MTLNYNCGEDFYCKELEISLSHKAEVMFMPLVALAVASQRALMDLAKWPLDLKEMVFLPNMGKEQMHF